MPTKKKFAWFNFMKRLSLGNRIAIIALFLTILFGLGQILVNIVIPFAVEIYKSHRDTKIVAYAPLFRGFNKMDDNFRVLILPFNPLENCILKDTYIEKTIEKEIGENNTEQAGSINVKFDTTTCKISTNDEGTKIGTDLYADFVIWGDIWEKCYPETTQASIKYCITDESTKKYKKIGLGFLTDASLRPVPKLDQIKNGYVLRDVNQIIFRIYATSEY